MNNRGNNLEIIEENGFYSEEKINTETEQPLENTEVAEAEDTVDTESDYLNKNEVKQVKENDTIKTDEIKEVNKIKKESIYKDIDSNILDVKTNKFLDVPTLGYHSYYRMLKGVERISDQSLNDLNISMPIFNNMSKQDRALDPITFTGFSINDKSEVTRGENVINSRFVTKNTKAVTSKYKIMSAVSSVLNGGKDIQIPLYNSGFRITFKYPPSDELYAIRKSIRTLAIENEIHTGGFLYNSTQILVVSEIIKHTTKYIVGTTLDYDKNKNSLYDYIDPLDYPLIIAGWSNALLPHGNITTITCKNTSVMVEKMVTREDGSAVLENVPKCNFMATGTLNIKDIVKVKDSRITDRMFEILNKRNSASVTLEEYKEYQKERLSFSTYKDKIIFEGNGSSIEFKLHTSNLTRYINIGNLYRSRIETELFSLGITGQENIVDKETDEDKKERNIEDKKLSIAEITEVNKLSSYLHFLKNVKVNDEIIDLTDMDGLEDNFNIVFEILSEFNTDDITRDKFLYELYEYISNITIAAIAVETFTCPDCQEKQTEEEEPIWLDPISFFSATLDYRFTNILD